MSTELIALVAVISFWGWVATSLLFIFKAFPHFGVFQSRKALFWGGASILCACLWIVALRNA